MKSFFPPDFAPYYLHVRITWIKPWQFGSSKHRLEYFAEIRAVTLNNKFTSVCKFLLSLWGQNLPRICPFYFFVCQYGKNPTRNFHFVMQYTICFLSLFQSQSEFCFQWLIADNLCGYLFGIMQEHSFEDSFNFSILNY